MPSIIMDLPCWIPRPAVPPETPEVQSVGILLIDLFRRWIAAKGQPVGLNIPPQRGQIGGRPEHLLPKRGGVKAVPPSRLRLVGVHWKGVIAAAAGMRDIIRTAADAAAVPGIHYVETDR